MPQPTRWEHFTHEADIGVRGWGSSLAEAFAQAAVALTAVICDPEVVHPQVTVKIDCAAPDIELLFADWLNALLYEMAVRRMLFSRFDVDVHDNRLCARAYGEPIDPPRHRPVVEIKGATYTELQVRREGDSWRAQTVLDV